MSVPTVIGQSATHWAIQYSKSSLNIYVTRKPQAFEAFIFAIQGYLRSQASVVAIRHELQHLW